MLNWIVDRLWPRITGPDEVYQKPEALFDKTSQTCLSEIAQFLFHQLEHLKQRQKTVESKLVSLLTLTSTLTTVIATAFVAVATFGTIEKQFEFYIIFAGLIVGYIAAQLTRALWCTISGLSRRKYRRLSESELIPKPEENSQSYQIRLYNLILCQIHQNNWVINRMVEDMAVAHVALKNAIFASFAMIPLAIVILLIRIYSSHAAP